VEVLKLMKFNKAIKLSALLATTLAYSNSMVAMEELKKESLTSLVSRLVKKQPQPSPAPEEKKSSWLTAPLNLVSHIAHKVVHPLETAATYKKEQQQKQATIKNEYAKEKNNLFAEHFDKENLLEFTESVLEWLTESLPLADRSYVLTQKIMPAQEVVKSYKDNLVESKTINGKKYYLATIEDIENDLEHDNKQAKEVAMLLKEYVNYIFGIESFMLIDDEIFSSKNYLVQLKQAIDNIANVHSKIEAHLS